jgi:hypothetical protein
MFDQVISILSPDLLTIIAYVAGAVVIGTMAFAGMIYLAENVLRWFG